MVSTCLGIYITYYFLYHHLSCIGSELFFNALYTLLWLRYDVLLFTFRKPLITYYTRILDQDWYMKDISNFFIFLEVFLGRYKAFSSLFYCFLKLIRPQLPSSLLCYSTILHSWIPLTIGTKKGKEKKN